MIEIEAEMTEEDQKILVNLAIYHQQHYIESIRTGPDYVRRLMWLHLLGLLETWDMTE